MSKDLFTAAEDEKLVEKVSKFPCLYDSACPLFKDFAVKDKSWRKVAVGVERSVDDCKKRWRNIKDTYRKRQIKGTGTGSSRYTKPKKWVLADRLSFLGNPDRKHGFTSYIESDGPSAHEEEEEEEQEDHAVSVEEIETTDVPKTCEMAADIEEEKLPLSNSYEPTRAKRPKNDKIIELLENRAKERLEILNYLSQTREDDIDLFFKSIAKSVKKLKPEFAHEAKIKSLQMVFELERRNSISVLSNKDV